MRLYSRTKAVKGLYKRWQGGRGQFLMEQTTLHQIQRCLVYFTGRRSCCLHHRGQKADPPDYRYLQGKRRPDSRIAHKTRLQGLWRSKRPIYLAQASTWSKLMGFLRPAPDKGQRCRHPGRRLRTLGRGLFPPHCIRSAGKC